VLLAHLASLVQQQAARGEGLAAALSPVQADVAAHSKSLALLEVNDGRRL
jgi:hypothetical protein